LPKDSFAGCKLRLSSPWPDETMIPNHITMALGKAP
jgi:hypothetical protein